MANSISETSDSGHLSISSHSSKSHGTTSSCSHYEHPPFSFSHHKPHKANQPAWQAMNKLHQEHGQVGLDQFQLMRRLGSGNIGTVYVCRIKNPATESPHCLYAMKVVDKEALKMMKYKTHRVDMEKEILRMLDHPFLPTLYAEFEVSKYSCLVMEYCHGGDLLSVLQRQPRLRFDIPSAKFYAAEVLLALEYLHANGIIYRDLKPENVLVQENGHIMLSDFDLSFKSDVVPKLLQYSSEPKIIHKNIKCKSRFSLSKFYKNKKKSKEASKVVHNQEFDKEFWAEPITARSCSLVGTHEYLAPETIQGLSHGNEVDWWALGIFLYELMHGKTPFRGENEAKTLKNILEKPLVFPRTTYSSDVKQCEEMGKAHDLINKLLAKNPKKRMGSFWGSVEIKKHEFFEGVNWALIRSATPPMIPSVGNKQKLISKNNDVSSHLDFF